jgi:error-prone DNA polymerase
MYPRRLILDDARRRGVPILPLDVNRSEPEYVVEEVAPAEAEVQDPARCSVGLSGRLVDAAQDLLPAGSDDVDPRAASSTRDPRSLPAPRHHESVALGGAASRGMARQDQRGSPPEKHPYGIRLALRDVHGISEAEIRSMLAARAERPFRDVGDLLRRTTVSRPVAEALAHAGAFDALPGDRNRRGHLYDAITVEAPHEGDQLSLLSGALGGAAQIDERALGGAASRGMARQGQRGSPPEKPPLEQHRFSEYTDAEIVKAELEVLGLDVTRHLVSFFEPLLADLGVTRAADLHRCRQDAWVMVAGVKIASQTPAVRSGQRIIFVSLDDATGPIEVTVFESVQPKVARTVFHAYALAVWGQLRRTGVKGMSVTAEEVWDLTALHRARREGGLRDALEAPVEPRAPARRLWHASPGSAG